MFPISPTISAPIAHLFAIRTKKLQISPRVYQFSEPPPRLEELWDATAAASWPYHHHTDSPLSRMGLGENRSENESEH
jgi:hypothetical protein